MIEETVLEKLRVLPQVQQQEVLDFVEFLWSRRVARPATSTTQEQLAAAAQALLADYESDAELTAFTALDGQDFHA